MRNEAYTPGAERALDAARRFAGGEKAASVTTRHLAHGLLVEDDGPASALAKRCGLQTAEWLKTQAIKPSTIEITVLSESAERMVWLARSLAREYFVDRTVTCDLLLVALCRCDDELIMEWRRFGFSEVELERIVMKPLVELVPLAEQPASTIPSLSPLRVMDANADRAREALRVLEDFCRFVLNDQILSSALKQIRHELAVALPTQALLTASGDTVNDVGTSIGTATEYSRSSMQDVATVNCKRLQESLRSLEEFGKVIDADKSRIFEQLRYRAYTVEQALYFARSARERLKDTRLYLLLGTSPNLESIIGESASGGIDIVQLREKHLNDRELLTVAQQVRRWTLDAKVLFIINDRPDIARLVDADGVHLGQDDISVAHARRIVGHDAIIGVSTHDLEQLRCAVLDGASYVGIGPTFPSSTKRFEKLAGLDFIREASESTRLPAFALGGITPDNVNQVIAAGATRIAVSAAVTDNGNPHRVARILRERLLDN